MSTIYVMPAGSHGAGADARAADQRVLSALRSRLGGRVHWAFQVAVPHESPAYYARSKLGYFTIRRRVAQAVQRAAFFGIGRPLLSVNFEEYGRLRAIGQGDDEAIRRWWRDHAASVRRIASAIEQATGRRALTNFDWSLKVYPDVDTLLELCSHLQAFGPNCYQLRDRWEWYTPTREVELAAGVGKRVTAFVNGKSKIGQDGSVVDVPEVHLHRQAEAFRALDLDWIIWCEINRPGAVEAALRVYDAIKPKAGVG